jgi:hypothetical protein
VPERGPVADGVVERHGDEHGVRAASSGARREPPSASGSDEAGATQSSPLNGNSDDTSSRGMHSGALAVTSAAVTPGAAAWTNLTPSLVHHSYTEAVEVETPSSAPRSLRRTRAAGECVEAA